VHPVSAHGLQRDLRRERGGEAGLEHVGALAGGAVLRQRAARLTHEPHGCALGALAAHGPHEIGCRGAAVGEGMRGGKHPSILASRSSGDTRRPLVTMEHVLFCLTANHGNADFELLDRISHTSAPAASRRLADLEFVRGAVVLATCNRFEVYLDLDDPLAAPDAVATEAVVAALAEHSPADAELLRASADAHLGESAVRHLFAV